MPICEPIGNTTIPFIHFNRDIYSHESNVFLLFIHSLLINCCCFFVFNLLFFYSCVQCKTRSLETQTTELFIYSHNTQHHRHRVCKKLLEYSFVNTHNGKYTHLERERRTIHTESIECDSQQESQRQRQTTVVTQQKQRWLK